MKADELATQKSLFEAQSDLEVLKSTFPLDVKTIIKVQEKIDSYTLGITAINRLKVELGLRDEDIKDL